MKKLYLIGNTKMNLDFSKFKKYFKLLKKASKNTKNFVGVCLSSPYLDLAQKCLKKSNVHYGTQNIYFEDEGAFTGEISAKMVQDFGVDLQIVGHSERRQYFYETDLDINKKIKKCLTLGIYPIFCFGENLQQRKENVTKKIIRQQLNGALSGIEKQDFGKIIFAYEPVWAIGTGVTATSKQAEEIAKFVKDYLNKHYGIDNCIFLYGGSMKPSNAFELLSQQHIDGGLIGGACLKVDEFSKIIDTAIV